MACKNIQKIMETREIRCFCNQHMPTETVFKMTKSKWNAWQYFISKASNYSLHQTDKGAEAEVRHKHICILCNIWEWQSFHYKPPFITDTWLDIKGKLYNCYTVRCLKCIAHLTVKSSHSLNNNARVSVEILTHKGNYKRTPTD